MSTKILNNPSHLLLAETLNELIIRDGKLTPTSLARKLGIPTNKITRILNGDVTDPKASTLLQIAACFGISIEQLLGIDPLLPKGEHGNLVPSQIIPIYELSYFNVEDKVREWYRWVDHGLNGNYYALLVNTDLYEPTFPQSSLLIVNPEITPEDRAFVIVTKKNNSAHCFIKKYVVDGDTIYLYPINPKLSIENYDANLYNMKGTILEVHQKLRKSK